MINIKRVEKIAIMAVILIAASYVANEIFRPNNPSYLEIREYEGENLSSINDFRENSIKGPQYVNRDAYRLLVTGPVNENGTYTYDQVINQHELYKKLVTLYCVEGWEVTIFWEGVLVKDLLFEAGLSFEANLDEYVVIFHAFDEYTTSLPLRYIIENNILIAHKMNNVILPPERGFPFQLVAESKWGYKWIKWITEIEVSKDVNYRGFWESRGYSNIADLDKGFLGD